MLKLMVEQEIAYKALEREQSMQMSQQDNNKPYMIFKHQVIINN